MVNAQEKLTAGLHEACSLSIVITVAQLPYVQDMCCPAVSYTNMLYCSPMYIWLSVEKTLIDTYLVYLFYCFPLSPCSTMCVQ